MTLKTFGEPKGQLERILQSTAGSIGRLESVWGEQKGGFEYRGDVLGLKMMNKVPTLLRDAEQTRHSLSAG